MPWEIQVTDLIEAFRASYDATRESIFAMLHTFTGYTLESRQVSNRAAKQVGCLTKALFLAQAVNTHFENIARRGEKGKCCVVPSDTGTGVDPCEAPALKVVPAVDEQPAPPFYPTVHESVRHEWVDEARPVPTPPWGA